MLEDATVALTLAQEPAGPAAPAGGNGTAAMIANLVPALLIGLVFYLLILKPAKRDRVEREELFANMKRNDEVVTAGGLVGTISSIPGDGKDVMIKVDGTRLRVRRDSIREIIPKSSKGSKDDSESDAAAG